MHNSLVLGDFNLDCGRKFDVTYRCKDPSRAGLEVERPLRIQLKAGHSYLGGFESRFGHCYIDVICKIITLCNNPLLTDVCYMYR